jgi:hypothetical protein
MLPCKCFKLDYAGGKTSNITYYICGKGGATDTFTLNFGYNELCATGLYYPLPDDATVISDSDLCVDPLSNGEFSCPTTTTTTTI